MGYWEPPFQGLINLHCSFLSSLWSPQLLNQNAAGELRVIQLQECSYELVGLQPNKRGLYGMKCRPVGTHSHL